MFLLLSFGIAVLLGGHQANAMAIVASSNEARGSFEEHESLFSATMKFARRTFDEADINANSCLTSEEFLALFDFYDANGNGRVSLAEFVAVSSLERVISSTVNSRRIFASGDFDQNGYIDRSSDVPEMRRRMGSDGNGCVTRDSFLRRFSQVAQILSQMFGEI